MSIFLLIVLLSALIDRLARADLPTAMTAQYPVLTEWYPSATRWICYFVMAVIALPAYAYINGVRTASYHYWPDIFDPFAVLYACGALLGVCLNRLYTAASTQNGVFSANGKFLIGLSVALFLAGSLGPKLFADMLSRVSKFSIAGVELQLSPAERAPRTASNRDPEGNPSLPKAAIGRAEFVSPIFGAVPVFQNMSRTIERDLKYIKAAARFTGKTIDDSNPVLVEMTNAKDSAEKFLSPIGECLRAIAQHTEDNETARKLLEPLLDPLRSLTFRGEQAIDDTAREAQIKIYEMATPAIRYAAQHGQRDACLKLAKTYCGGGHGLNRSLDSTVSQIAYCIPSTSDGTGGFATVLKSFMQNEGNRKRPYLSMLAAAIYLEIGKAETALLTMDRWLRDFRKIKEEERADVSDYHEMRALQTINLLMEVAIRQDGQSASTERRTIHIARLDEILSMADKLLGAGNEIGQLRHPQGQDFLERTMFAQLPTSGTQCDKLKQPAIDDVKLRKQFHFWYLAMRATSAHHKQLHPKYAQIYAHDVRRTIRDLLEIDVGCAADTPDLHQFRADVLRMYARTQLYDSFDRPLATAADLKAQINQALQATNLGIRTIEDLVESESRSKTDLAQDKQMRDRLAPSELRETYDFLRDLRAQIAHQLAELNQ